MPYLGSFRKGWESENLARFILSKFSFIAHPSTVSDDIGSDFFCTLFQIHTIEDRDYLIPKNSFAIQIKSNPSKFNVSDKVQYLSELETPFFVGVINRNELKLTIYSGKYIPLFFPHEGHVDKLEIELCEAVKPERYYVTSSDGYYTLKFPKIMEIGADVEPEELKPKINNLSQACASIHKNIASRKSKEYLFEFESDGPPLTRHFRLLAGSGSVKVFRLNFLKRLAEVFYNLEWIHKNPQLQLDEEEFKIYEKLFYDLESLYQDQPQLQHALEYVKNYLDSLKTLIQSNKDNSS